jgi:pimeloyl-ACP methyl ester carboxylesterase
MIAMLRWFEHSQVYHPDRQMSANGAELGRPFEDATFKAADGVELNGWFYPADPNSPRAQRVVLLCHGNAGNIGHRLEMCAALLETGVTVFLLDYRGYGRSRGRPTEQGTYQDAAAAYAWLKRKGFAGANIIVMGESLGGGVASELPLREPVAALILQSTFTSIPDIGAEVFPWLPVRWFATIRYDTHGRLARLKVPVLVMHSRTDDLIGFHHAQKNFAAANEPKLLWEIKGDHNNPLTDRAQFVAGIETFLKLVETNGASGRPVPATGVQTR